MEYPHFGFGNNKITERALRHSPHDIFELPTYNEAYQKRVEHTFYADNIQDSNGPYRVQIFGNPTQYMDTANMRFCYKLKFIHKNGNAKTRVPKFHDVSVVTLPASSLWKSINVAINNVDIPEATQEHYAHKVYDKICMSNSPDSVYSTLTPQLAFFDLPNTFTADVAANNYARNYGSKAKAATKEAAQKVSSVADDARGTPFWLRNSIFVDYETVDLITPSHLDIFETETYFPPNTNITLQFNRNPPKFYIVSFEGDNEQYDLEIEQLSVIVPFVTLAPEIYNSHLKMFAANKLACIFFEKVLPKTKYFPANITELQFERLSQGTIPKAVYIMMINTEDIEGKWTTSPFIYRHNNASEVTLKIDNMIFPNQPIKTNFGGSTNFMAYDFFLRNIGMSGNTGCLVTAEKWLDATTIWAYDLSPEMCNNFHVHPGGQGTLDLTVTLSKALPKATTMLVFLSYNRIMYLDAARNVTFQTI